MSEIHFGSHFWSFYINTDYFLKFFLRMAAGGHFGSPKITFDLISIHFKSINNFLFLNFDKMADVGHFGCPNFTFDLISGHFRSILNFNFFLNF